MRSRVAAPSAQVRDAVVVSGSRRLLDQVSLTAAPGRMLAVTGPSGSGKTTLLGVLTGLVAPDSGSVLVDGRPVVPGDRPPDGTGIVLQSYGLVPVLDAAENVEIVLQLRRLPPDEVGRRAEEALLRLGLEGVGRRLVEELSGGQQQRVAVARALVGQPSLLVADEPTSELDAVTRDRVVRELRREAERGAAVVIATHDPDVTAACDEILHLVDGRVSPPAR